MRRYKILVKQDGEWSSVCAGLSSLWSAAKVAQRYALAGNETRIGSYTLRIRGEEVWHEDSPSLQDTAPLEYFTER